MSENKFIRHLQGKDTAKSVLEIRNQKTPTSFANMPDGTSNANDVYSDRRGDAAGVLKGTENWKLNNSLLIETSTVYGDGRDFTDDFEVGGSGLWVNAICTFTTARRFAPNTKFVLKLCGHDLDTVAEQTVGFTLIVKFGSTVITKVFSVPVQAFDFCKEFEIDFGESNSSAIKVAANSTMQVQLLCADANAQATIYNGMTVFTALQRRVDSETVSSDTLSLDEIETDLTTHIANKNNPHEVTKAQVGLGNCDNTSDLDKPISTATQTALDGKVNKTGDTMSGALNIANIASSNSALLTLTHSSTTTYKWNIAPRYNSTTLSVYPGSTETNGFRFATTGFVPASNNARYLGSASLKWKGVYTGVLNNGADLVVPNKVGTLATMDDVELAARSGTQLTDQGVWYAKMYAATVAPAAENGTNYADFSQVDGQGNPIIVTYNRVNGAWVQDQTITPPAEYDGYVIVTSKIWDIAEQTGQQGGRVLWNHTSKEFTPYPQIISFEDIGITGDSTVVMPQNPGANQIVNKNYVDEAIASIPTPTVDVLLSPDIKIVGLLTQNGSAFSGFSINDYLTLPWDPVDLRAPFEFVVGANLTAGTLNQQIAGLVGTVYGGGFTLLYSGSTGELMFNGVYGNVIISGPISTNTDYLIKVSWDGTDYKMFVSADNGATYTQIGSTVSNTGTCGYGVLGFGKSGGTQYYEDFLGTINLSGAYLKIGENIVWAGMDAPGLQQRVIKGHEVIEFQAPTAQNNYTWYRKYADGWVEQGGVENTLTTTTRDVTLPVVMADGNYTVTIGQYVDNAAGQYVYIRNAPEATKLVIKANSGTIAKAYWCVSGMAA